METKNEMSARHKEEWARFRARYLAGDLEEAEARVAKIHADILKVYQEGERKAFGFTDADSDAALSIAWEEG